MITRDIDRHSEGCYFCGKLFDERDGRPADPYNGGDGGEICPECLPGKIRYVVYSFAKHGFWREGHGWVDELDLDPLVTIFTSQEKGNFDLASTGAPDAVWEEYEEDQ